MKAQEHIAIGPALGFVYQFERATYRLLSADTTVISVGVEDIDDVSEHRADGSTVSEQNKLTTGARRPLTDRSTALWKTLSIWAAQVAKIEDAFDAYEFHLVTNGDVADGCLARRLHDATTQDATNAIAAELRLAAPTLREELSAFGQEVLGLGVEKLSALIAKIFVFDRVSPAFGGNLQDIPSLRYFGDVQRTAIFDNAAGWVRRSILSAALTGEPTTIDRTVFDIQVRGLIRRVQVAPLAALISASDVGTVDPGSYHGYGFFRQLEWVDADPDLARDCVIHYVSAKAARIRWTDAGDISEASLSTYESDLKDRWKLIARVQALKAGSSPEMSGAELLLTTLAQDVPLDGQPMPRAITCGSYHALADFDTEKVPEVGWHPNYLNLSGHDKK